jgi:hypothetical protein
MISSQTRYAKSGDVSIAYQVTGSGPFDLVFVPGFVSNLDGQLENPGWSRFFSRLCTFSRLIRFDKRVLGCLTVSLALPILKTAWTTFGQSWMPWAPSVQLCSEFRRAAR